MEQPKFYMTKGSLVRCEKSDLVNSQNQFTENKIFFIRDIVTRDFYGIYKITDANFMIDYPDNQSTINYWNNQINYLLSHNLIYKLTDSHINTYYSFKLYLKTASEFDLFYGSTNRLIINTVYYYLNSNGSFIGPNQITRNDDPAHFRNKMDKGEILVISKKQLFEPYSIQKAS